LSMWLVSTHYDTHYWYNMGRPPNNFVSTGDHDLYQQLLYEIVIARWNKVVGGVAHVLPIMSYRGGERKIGRDPCLGCKSIRAWYFWLCIKLHQTPQCCAMLWCVKKLLVEETWDPVCSRCFTRKPFTLPWHSH
jgi:hypothetical protein